MSELLLHHGKIVGTLTEKNWCQAHTFFPEDAKKQTLRGHLLAVVSFSTASQQDIASQGRELITRLHEEYYGELKTPVLKKLKGTLAKIQTEVGEVSDLSISMAVLIKNVLSVAILGQGHLILQRKGRVATILAGREKGQIVTAKGRLEEDDLFLLGTAEFFKLVSFETIQAALKSERVEQIVEVLSPLIHSQPENGLLAAVVANVEKPKKLQEKNKKNFLKLGLVLFFLLALSVFWGHQQRIKKDRQTSFAQALEQIQLKKEEGQALIGLNPVRAKELLLEAQNLLKQIESEEGLPEKYFQFKKEVEALLPEVLREHEVTLEDFYDLELIKKSAQADDVVLMADQMIVLDKKQAALYQLGLDNKNQKILASGENFKDAFQLAVTESEIFALTKQGVLQVSSSGKKQTLVIEEDFGETSILATFGDNLYILTPKDILVYPGDETGFGSSRSWLSEPVSLGNAVDMVIDGAIWILQKGGTILKLIQGGKTAFGVAGLDKPLAATNAFYTDPDQERLYVLDQDNGRVVVLEKNGEYHSQYLWEGIKNVDHLVVAEEKGRIFLFSGSKIYETEIK